MKPIVQISLDLTDVDEPLETAALAMRAGVDWALRKSARLSMNRK